MYGQNNRIVILKTKFMIWILEKVEYQDRDVENIRRKQKKGYLTFNNEEFKNVIK